MRPDHGFAADSAVPFLRLFLEDRQRQTEKRTAKRVGCFYSGNSELGRGSQRGDLLIQRSLFFAFVVYVL